MIDYSVLIKRFIAYHINFGHSTATTTLYERTLNEFFYEHLKGKDISEITKEDIYRFREHKDQEAAKRKKNKISGQGTGRLPAKDKISNTSMNTYLTAIKGFLIFISSEYPKALPLAQEIKKLKVQQIFDIVDFEDLAPIFERKTIENFYHSKYESKKKTPENFDFYVDRLKILIDFVGSTGARAAEITSLKQIDLKLDRKIPFVTIVGKGNKLREIALSRIWVEDYKEFCKKYPIASKGENVFNKIDGQPLSYSTHKTYIKELSFFMKVPRLSIHKLRHCYALLKYERDKDIESLRKNLGHESLDTTRRYLSKVSLRADSGFDVLKQARKGSEK